MSSTDILLPYFWWTMYKHNLWSDSTQYSQVFFKTAWNKFHKFPVPFIWNTSHYFHPKWISGFQNGHHGQLEVSVVDVQTDLQLFVACDILCQETCAPTSGWHCGKRFYQSQTRDTFPMFCAIETIIFHTFLYIHSVNESIFQPRNNLTVQW